MKGKSVRLLIALFVLAMSASIGFGQVTSLGSLSGTVTDPKGAVVPGATVVVKNNATNQEFTTTTSSEGTFNVPALMEGEYTATITAQGFKQAVVTAIKINVNQPSSIAVGLEVGSASEVVTVVGGGELLQTQTQTVGTTITGRQITELPYASRNALDLLLFLPGTNTAGRPRQSTVNGLPKSMINITLDGLNIQDNVLKGSDGFFTLIQPKTDAISEVSVSTATPGAESNAEGAVQIKFTTRSGSSEFHGSIYEEHRDKSLNSNFFWNNMLLAPKDVGNGRPRAPRTPALLNQFGGRIGGPIKAPHLFNSTRKGFFFANYEEYRLPEAQLRTRNILSANAVNGIFQYGTTSVNLYTVAAASNCQTVTGGPVIPCTSTPDPTIAALMSSIRGAQGTITTTTDPNINQLTFTNTGGQKRQFPTARFDFELNKKNHIETIYNYQIFRGVVDFLNSADPFAPGFPNHGAQNSNRYSSSTAWRATIKPNVVNEARFGVQNGMVLFFPEVNPGQFTNQQGFSLGISAAAAGISNVTTANGPQRRNTPTNQLSDNLSWVKGKHTLNFGGDLTSVSTWLVSYPNGAVPAVSFAQDTSDIIETAMFTSGNFPGSSATNRNQADTLYRVLTGRLTSISHVASLGEDGKTYSLDNIRIERYRQREIGFYGQDSWRFRSNLTLNFGLREEIQYAPISQNLADTQNTFTGLFSTSGTGLNALFKPGATGGTLTTFTSLPIGQHLYNTTYNLAPTVGFAWQPNFKHGLLKKLAGNSGQTVIRGGWSIAYDREGLNLTSSIVGANFGGTIDLTQNAGGPNARDFARGSLLRAVPPLPANPAAPVFPLTPGVFDQASANAFLPSLKTPYVISFSGSIQREITKDTVLEVGYVGNRGHQLLRQFNLNEVNVIENGFVNEFRLAQQNLYANIAANRCQAGVTTAGCNANFAYFGPGTGTNPLPTTLAYFRGVSDPNNPAQYTSSFFRNSSFTGALATTNARPITFAGLLNNPLNGLTTNAAAAGLPANLFVVNPQMAIAGSFLVNNDGKTWYDALTVQLRRRLSKGILVDGNYTFSRALGNQYVSSAIAFLQPRTLRNTWLDKGFSPFDIRSSLKGSFIAEMPFGRGKHFLGNSHGFLEGVVGNWTINGTLRLSSGVPINLGNVQLVGMTPKDLEKAIQMRTNSNHQVFWLPDDIIQNTILAFATTGTTASGFSGAAPSGRYFAPAAQNCVQQFAGQCGFANLIVHGPRFTRLDLGIEKKIKISETKNFEFRFEFLNAFKNTDFRLGSYSNDTVILGSSTATNNTIAPFTSTSFGQIFGSDTAYRDVSTTNDPGGRVGQIVVRFNF
jgi:Carboxypeptidase regulatory-like domain